MLNVETNATEAVLATIGVSPLISKKVETFKKSQLDESQALPKKIERMTRQLAKDDFIDLPLFEASYSQTLRDLYDEWKPEQVEAMAKAMEKWIPDLTVEFMAKAKNVIDFLRSIFPRASYTTFIGSTNVVPTDVAIYQFESVLDVLNNPLRVFPLMANGSITKRQIAAVRLVYPTVSAAIDEALITVVADYKAEKKTFELPPAAEIGVTKWFGKPAIDPKLAAQLQAVSPKPKDASSPVPSSKTPKASVLAKESLTSAQRATYTTLK